MSSHSTRTATLDPPASARPTSATPALSPVRRTAQLLLGLLAYTASMAMLLHAGQGGMPWDVLHQGVVETTGWSFGAVVALTSGIVLAAWIPLRQRPGWGTVANVVVISVAIGPALAAIQHLAPAPGPVTQAALAVGGIVVNGVATAAYVGVRLGPGPRDGLLTGLMARTGLSARTVKTGIEVAVVLLGWLLGGTLGWATVAYAFGVGVVVQAAARRRWLVPGGLVDARPAPRSRGGRRRTPPVEVGAPSGAGKAVPTHPVPEPPSAPSADGERRVRVRAGQIARALDGLGDG